MNEVSTAVRSAAKRGRSVAFLGDSITADGNWAEWFANVDAINFGVSGDTTDDVIERLGSVIDARPDEICLLIGANDLGQRLTVEHVVRNIQLMLVELRRALPGSRTLVASIMPRSREFTQRIREANIHLRQFAPCIHAQYLDLWPALATDSGELNPAFSEDQLHLNDAGYQAWLGELRPALDRLATLPPMSRPIQLAG